MWKSNFFNRFSLLLEFRSTIVSTEEPCQLQKITVTTCPRRIISFSHRFRQEWQRRVVFYECSNMPFENERSFWLLPTFLLLERLDHLPQRQFLLLILVKHRWVDSIWCYKTWMQHNLFLFFQFRPRLIHPFDKLAFLCDSIAAWILIFASNLLLGRYRAVNYSTSLFL